MASRVVGSATWAAILVAGCAGQNEPRLSDGQTGIDGRDGDAEGTAGALCGNGRRDPGEACDDGNRVPFDGCSPTCQQELDCQHGPCESVCGDGLVLAEACDDGNLLDGDGCSKDCEVEDGFSCVTGGSCESQDGACQVRVPVTYRDFTEEHPDFGVGCGELLTGLVEPDLGPNGKPVLLQGGPACIQSPESFAEWYTDSPQNVAIQGELTLWDNGAGAFVNRYGPRGEPWKDQQGTLTFDGDPLFFPIDEAPEAFDDLRAPAKIPEQYGYPGWPWESSVNPDAPLHNFHFTTEVDYWFLYNEKAAARLEFSGDDDLWVFVNGKLAVDLGGPHVPETGSITLDAEAARSFGLVDGRVYEIRVFHAERKREGSSFRLTLTGFDMQRSECRPICGDGIVQAGEDCDDGNREDGDECPASCLFPVEVF